MRLADVAHGRSGDKGDRANVGIVVYDLDDYEFVRTFLTEAYVADVFDEFLREPGPGSVDRYGLPELGALNFVLHGVLDGGASESLRTDVQGKTFAAMLLRSDITSAYAAFDE